MLVRNEEGRGVLLWGKKTGRKSSAQQEKSDSRSQHGADRTPLWREKKYHHGGRPARGQQTLRWRFASGAKKGETKRRKGRDRGLRLVKKKNGVSSANIRRKSAAGEWKGLERST